MYRRVEVVWPPNNWLQCFAPVLAMRGFVSSTQVPLDCSLEDVFEILAKRVERADFARRADFALEPLQACRGRLEAAVLVPVQGELGRLVHQLALREMRTL